VLQPSFDHFVAQPIGIFANRWTGYEAMLLGLIRFGLLPDVLVIARQTFVWHIFYTQKSIPTKMNPTLASRRHSRDEELKPITPDVNLNERFRVQEQKFCCRTATGQLHSFVGEHLDVRRSPGAYFGTEFLLRGCMSRPLGCRL
jgi:hypothetical protein